jgi:squalene-hopene/tetraprenyl-beta-curcumene cyclase
MSPDHRSPAEVSLFESLQGAWGSVQQSLFKQKNARGHWTGELSTSALSTATAISALAQMVKSNCLPEELIDQVPKVIAEGCQWLCQQQNEDGGFGDTNRSHSNIATSYLVLAAWKMGQGALSDASQQDRWLVMRRSIEERRLAVVQYIEQQGSWDGLRARYGKDKTFVVPILSNCALAGMVDWREVPPLPFEAAWLPQEWYRWARLPVVSYAVPALVAIGQARFHFAPPANPVLRALRRRAMAPTLKVLRSMQPTSGGYLEATPLTSFVLMNLAAIGQGNSLVARESLRFLIDSRLSDGSWPIDTNLATWVTSLAIRGLATRGLLKLPMVDVQRQPQRQVAVSQVADKQMADKQMADKQMADKQMVGADTIRWLLSCQHRRRHPFTGANPGGWGWTDLSGAVPDADDTPAALLALHSIDWAQPGLQRLEAQSLDAVGWGLTWLLRLQNRDGGWPTFCRGWGTLPFDRSGSDLTAHALRALHVWLPRLTSIEQHSSCGQLKSRTFIKAIESGLGYLERQQRADGSWLPLWFGNQDRPEEDNPVYGTGKVLVAYGLLGRQDSQAARRGTAYLLENQNGDGGWGGGTSQPYGGFSPNVGHLEGGKRGGSSIEETAIAVEGLLWSGQGVRDASIMQALGWLVQAIQSGNLECSSPIGFYFAKLWYHERLYPTLFSLGALGEALTQLDRPRAPSGCT